MMSINALILSLTSLEKNVFIILSGKFGRTIISIVRVILQINSIYIFCDEVSAEHEQWARQGSKVRGVFTQISFIFDALKRDARYYDQNDVSISFIPPTDDVSKQNMD